jgi:hypothetical protein
LYREESEERRADYEVTFWRVKESYQVKLTFREVYAILVK